MPKGLSLIVDVDLEDIVLDAVICEGNLIFADNKDINFNAHYILIRRGQIIAGTEAAAY